MSYLLLVLLLAQTSPKSLGVEDQSRKYWPVTIDTISKNNHNHIVVEGIVVSVYIAGDGDIHIRIRDEHNHRLTMEIIPMMRSMVVRPKLKQRIRVYGVFRMDPWHSWPEIHPVEKIEILK